MSSADQSSNSLAEKPPSIEYSLMKAHGIAALSALIFSALIGAFISVKMHMPDMAGNHAFTTWGRLRYDHTQGIFFGWLGNAFLMFMYHAVPRLANRPVLSSKLGWLIFGIWNFAVLLPGWGLVLAGYSQALEWAEFPLVIDAFVVLSLILSVAQFVVPILKARLSKLYVSGWYIIGGFVFTALAYPVGNIVPQLVPGAQGAAFSGLWIHDAIGLYVTPLALAMAYMVIPAVTKRPIYSHFLSMIGFWLLFFVYPLNGTHHYVFSAIPMEAQQAAIAASVLLGVDVILVVTNLLMSMKGSIDLFRQDLPLRFVCMGIIFYLIVSLQGSLQALMPVNKLVHFSDWVIGHSHLAMLGFASFVAIGGITHAWQQIPTAKYNSRALSHAYWLLLVGVIFMVLDLSLAGLVEANVWQSGLPWIESVREVRKLWVARSFVAIPIIGGLISLLVSMLTGSQNQAAPAGETIAFQTFHEQPSAQLAADASAKKNFSILNMAYLSASVAGVGFFILSFGILAIAPGLAIESDLKKSKPVTMLPLTASENRGREIYAREGCAYCHTQQVRAVAADVDRFGATTRAWETVYDYPQLWGTRRVGPDLARETGVRSDDWQLAHLYNPRLVVRDSVMPPYKWMFKGSADQPSQEALDLLAYIKSLGKARQLSGFSRQGVPPYCECPDEVKGLETVPLGLYVNANAARQVGPVTKLHVPQSAEETASYQKHGALLFEQNCASCHGATGKGDGEAAVALMPRPADLSNRRLSDERISFVLNNGVYGTAMPAWRDLPQDDLAALQVYVKGLHSDSVKTVASPDLTKVRVTFVKNCASCHGVGGGGDGPAAAALFPRPTNFFVDGPSQERAFSAISEGVPGTSMPPWKDQLTRDERETLATYVASLYFDPNRSKLAP